MPLYTYHFYATIHSSRFKIGYGRFPQTVAAIAGHQKQ